MTRGRRTKLEPWIEQVILSYGTEPEEKKNTLMKAHVVGVGRMSESQARQTEGLTTLLFLSDGVVHIPAILTQDAWETLQEQEDRECFSSLINCTVCVFSYTLKFNMDSEQTKSQFYLSVGELTTTSAGAAKDNTPCCTSLNSVRQRICTTWRSLLAQDSVHTQNTQSEFSLSELLGEWQHDWRQSLLKDVMELLRTPTNLPSPQASTSNALTYTGTRWAFERFRYKREDTFNVPVSHLHIPDDLSQKLHAPSEDNSETQSGLVPPSEDRPTDPPETDQPIVAADSRQTDRPMPLERRHPSHEPTLSRDLCLLTEESMDGEVVSGVTGGAVASPWDMFAPAAELLRTSSASDESITSEPLPLQKSQSLLDSTPQPVTLATFPLATSTQVPSLTPGATQRSGERSLPPYQKPGPSHSLLPSSGSSFTVSLSTKNQHSGMKLHHGSSTTAHQLTITEQQDQVEEEEDVVKRWCSKAKRKSSVQTSEDNDITLEEEDMQKKRSPPSWMFETQDIPRIGEGSSCNQNAVAAIAPQRPSNVHSDGTLFSYSYQLCGHISKDLSHLKIPDGMLHWAVRYLVPSMQTEVVKDTQLRPQTHPS
ncbi:adrenocortical dysplasia protein homolog isoform X1 [Oncorhynchus keta]|uniref:adrenocortical dysplasia protein homolog isoform X1 n=1 Tax=Oncorhynchus keta TaxID=8018 RepID=UPI0015FC50B0|nr:adrenocortical dysplasia protein homolog isoform X1 [Oncorhynchus keta]